jgi:AcrR family transcriptional regulator
MTASTRSRRVEKIAETTAKLVSAARRSFAERGYAHTSMDDLCAEVGLTRGALYHHFGGKEGLLEAVVRQIDADIEARLQAEFDAIEDRWEAFATCCTTYLRLALDPEIQRIVLKDAPAVLGQRLREIDEGSSLQPMIDCLGDLMAQGLMRRTDPEALARMLNGAMMDAALWIAASEDPEAALAASRDALMRMLEGLRSGSPTARADRDAR